MAENKQYITQAQDNGAVMISDNVVAAIVVNALKDVEGVVGINAKLGVDLKNWNKGLKITITEENEITVDCSLIVAYGHSVIVVAKAAQDAIASGIENMTGIKPSVVNVNVSGIARQ